MPVAMSFHNSPAFQSPRGGIESGNKLGSRPIVRQSKLYREKESGNAMKSLFGQDHLSWKTNQQEGIFAGQTVHDAAANSAPTAAPVQELATGAMELEQCEEIEYPNPGSVASCDACSSVVDRYYHCMDCAEHQGGLFDLCSECCAALYLKQGSPRALAQVRAPAHPTHQYASHRMQQVCPPGS